MTKETRDYTIEKSKELIASPTCSAEAKSAAQAWIEAAGTNREEAAKGIAAHAMEIKEKGALYCDCPACAAVEAILKKKELLLD